MEIYLELYSEINSVQFTETMEWYMRYTKPINIIYSDRDQTDQKIRKMDNIIDFQNKHSFLSDTESLGDIRSQNF